MTKVLIDSSSWIHFFNQSSKWHFESVAEIIREDRGVICGLIFTEVLRGARNQKEGKIIAGYFDLLEYIPLVKQDHLEAANLGFQLARKGVVVKTIDLIIAHLAIKNRFALIHQDRDFERIKIHTRLKTLTTKSE